VKVIIEKAYEILEKQGGNAEHDDLEEVSEAH